MWVGVVGIVEECLLCVEGAGGGGGGGVRAYRWSLAWGSCLGAGGRWPLCIVGVVLFCGAGNWAGVF